MAKKAKNESAGDELYTTYETVDRILRTHIADGKLRGNGLKTKIFTNFSMPTVSPTKSATTVRKMNGLRWILKQQRSCLKNLKSIDKLNS